MRLFKIENCVLIEDRERRQNQDHDCFFGFDFAEPQLKIRGAVVCFFVALAEAVSLAISGPLSPPRLDLLLEELSLTEADVYQTAGLLGLAVLTDIYLALGRLT